ncbi:MAG: hypothetical protein ISR79_03500 [Nitrosopumilus sp.]|nr:hypothetical protein [Nitrosopumilus sp.]
MPVEYAQIISTLDQRPDTINPVPVFMDKDDAIFGIGHSPDHPADIQITESGVYVLIAAPQVGRTSGNGPSHVDFWLRKNNEDIPNSNVRCTITSDTDKDVVVNQTMSAFKAGDIVNVMMAVEKVGEGLGIEAIKTSGRPLIPSIIFSMHKIKDSVDGRWVSSEKGTKKLWVEGS